MKTYTFTYFCDDGSGFKSHDYHVRVNSFAQAFRSFCDFFNGLVVGVKDYYHLYMVYSTKCTYRTIPSKFRSSLHSYVPEV